MLKKVRLKNFKLHEDTSIEASRITVFIGPNNSGKSSVFQALLALRQASALNGDELCRPARRSPTSEDQPFLFPQGELVELGEFTHLCRRGERIVQIGAEGSLPISVGTAQPAHLDVSFLTRIEDNHLTAHVGELGIPYGHIVWDWVRGEAPPRTGQVSLTVEGVPLHFAPHGRFSLLGFAGYATPPSDQRQRQAEIVALGNTLGEAVRGFLNTLRPVLPLRGFEEQGYPLPERKPESIDLLSLSDRAVSLAALLAYDRDLEDKISEILAEVLGIKVKVRLVQGKRATVWAEPVDKGRSENPLLSEGSGASQLPYILVPLALAGSSDTLLISEPEAHLHPRLQSELTAMFLKVFRFAGGDLQFFIETHSEHVLHRLLHAVAKGELAQEDLTIYYFENKQGKSEARKLVVDEKGGVEGGLPGFFDQSLDELNEYLEALKQTKK